MIIGNIENALLIYNACLYIKVLCLIACYVEDPNSEAYKRHLVRIPDYFWLAEDGMKMQVYFTKSSNDLKQCWAHLNEGGNRMVIPYSFRMVIVMYIWPKNDRSVLHIESSIINGVHPFH